jgi:CheY-like chemotaxis protein
VAEISGNTVMLIKKILIVDDSSPTRKMLSRLLRGSGYECAEADDGVSCIECFKSLEEDINSGTHAK